MAIRTLIVTGRAQSVSDAADKAATTINDFWALSVMQAPSILLDQQMTVTMERSPVGGDDWFNVTLCYTLGLREEQVHAFDAYHAAQAATSY